jgi:flagellar biosynthesis component FlhA
MKTIVHAGAGTLAIILIAGFLAATLISELLLEEAATVAVKKTILTGLCLLIPALAITGGSGFSLARDRHSPSIERKRRRMKLIAANGLLILLPLAILLYLRAAAGLFDSLFYALQALEVLAGCAQLSLLVLNFRDGRKMTRAKRLAAARKLNSI